MNKNLPQDIYNQSKYEYKKKRDVTNPKKQKRKQQKAKKLKEKYKENQENHPKENIEDNKNYVKNKDHGNNNQKGKENDKGESNKDINELKYNEIRYFGKNITNLSSFDERKNQHHGLCGTGCQGTAEGHPPEHKRTFTRNIGQGVKLALPHLFGETELIAVEGDALAGAEAVGLGDVEIGVERDVCHRVRHPLEADAGADVHPVVLGVVHTVAESGVHVIEEHLAVGLRECGGAGMVPAQVASHSHEAFREFLPAILPYSVHSSHLALDDTSAAPPSTASSAAVATVVGVVGRAHDGNLIVVHKALDAGRDGIPVVGAVCDIRIDEPSLLGSLLDREVEDGLLLAIVDTCDAGIVA